MKHILSALLVLLLTACGTRPDASPSSAAPATSDTAAAQAEPSSAQPAAHREQSAAVEPGPAPEKFNDYVPEAHKLLGHQTGDLNLDGIDDAVLVIAPTDEAETSDVTEHPTPRPCILLTGNADGTYTQARWNDKVAMCVNCGGIWGDPFSGITIKNGYFSIEHYGGSNWRWVRIITFKYDKAAKEWYLHKVGVDSYHTSDPDKVTSKSRTTKDFGKVKFEEYDVYADGEED